MNAILTYFLILAAGVVIGFFFFYFFFHGKRLVGRETRAEFPDLEAESILTKRNFKILEKLKSAPIITYVDGKSHMSTSTADYIVEKDNRKFAVKVAREVEADPTDPQNRRHLIELMNIFPDYKILFLNPNKEEIHEIDFEFIRPQREWFFTIILGLIIIIAVSAVVFFMVQLKLF